MSFKFNSLSSNMRIDLFSMIALSLSVSPFSDVCQERAVLPLKDSLVNQLAPLRQPLYPSTGMPATGSVYPPLAGSGQVALRDPAFRRSPFW